MTATAEASVTVADEPVNVPGSGEVMAEQVREYVRRYVALDDVQADAVTLWAVHTHVWRAAECTPYLQVTSSEPRCGKTRLLEVLELVVHNPWMTGRVTGPALVRKVDAERPTLLLDETDATFTGGQASYQILRGVLNTGYRINGRTSYAVGGSYRDLATFCPKAFAGIGDLPGTIADRSIRISLKRRDFEKVERFRRRQGEREAQVVRARLKRWASGKSSNGGTMLDRLTVAAPDIPAELDDRAADVWEPLLAISDELGGDWPVRAREASISLMADRRSMRDTETQDAFLLLADIRTVFDALGADRVPTSDLIASLAELDDRWLDVNGKQLDGMVLADMLRPYGAAPAKIRFGRSVLQGYARHSFRDGWDLVGAEDVAGVVTTP